MAAWRWLILVALLSLAPVARAADVSGTAFAGWHTANVWEEVVFLDDVQFLDARLVGMAAALEWPVSAHWSAGVEAQFVRHWGSGSYWEVAVPATLRFRPGRPRGPFRSAGLGLGLSRTSEAPDIEARRTGLSRRTLFYWFIEAEFATPHEGLFAILRLHHRSSGYGYFGDSGSSNAVALGVRRRF
jgi:hypothetical protein